ncbi:hypothetical protein D9756_011096 [Leucocoprinus leucothites]|uniref:Uncharacterized protein n=1 Tax=Leucocoprinus leucothites TaxID=201217 RepID=A0A8H5FPY9_9AGAR|nr:hypothetical protein D9756_011096 [Leucoagaricus leucothites]
MGAKLSPMMTGRNTILVAACIKSKRRTTPQPGHFPSSITSGPKTVSLNVGV